MPMIKVNHCIKHECIIYVGVTKVHIEVGTNCLPIYTQFKKQDVKVPRQIYGYHHGNVDAICRLRRAEIFTDAGAEARLARVCDQLGDDIAKWCMLGDVHLKNGTRVTKSGSTACSFRMHT